MVLTANLPVFTAFMLSSLDLKKEINCSLCWDMPLCYDDVISRNSFHVFNLVCWDTNFCLTENSIAVCCQNLRNRKPVTKLKGYWRFQTNRRSKEWWRRKQFEYTGKRILAWFTFACDHQLWYNVGRDKMYRYSERERNKDNQVQDRTKLKCIQQKKMISNLTI